MLNKKQLFALLLVGSLSSAMYAADGDAPVAAPANPDENTPGYSRYLHIADDYLNYGNKPFDWLFGKVQGLGVKTKLAVYAAVARIAYLSKDIVVEEAGNLADAVQRSVGLGSCEDSRSAQCWECE